MKQSVTVKVYDQVGLDEQTQKILDVTVVHMTAMTISLIVVSKGEAPEGIALNPVEDCFCGVQAFTQKSFSDETGEELENTLARRFANYFKMCELEMKVEVQVA
ncbi:hypothetical protein [Sporosarcina sp. Te-1]|uniref:hypothetical protein n=1 Tax=Sporosarcina sp. Te-1 TaxID=2818390 RepID=UPI001A9CC053|nr:hypothetical protein [Sporosarcina sp. Te-1]QTD40068.1 hypothetical protein J3U78_14720 [Sporosarcina sp. Te-1]